VDQKRGLRSEDEGFEFKVQKFKVQDGFTFEPGTLNFELNVLALLQSHFVLGLIDPKFGNSL
jgi:hypothetical protein